MASLAELERDWSIDDVAIAHAWLDEIAEKQGTAQAAAAARARERNGGG